MLDRAWNNFVQLSAPAQHAKGSELRAAAIASYFMGLANNGGLNSFLTSSYDLDAQEVVEALLAVGATQAARELLRVLRGLRRPLPVMSQDERWNALDRCWPESLDQFDRLSREADDELMRVLEAHVGRHHEYYWNLGDGPA